jgi:hypothetical protein
MAQLIWALAVITFWIAVLVGWVLNIITVVHADFSTLTGELIVRCAGIFVAPIGAVMGLFF